MSERTVSYYGPAVRSVPRVAVVRRAPADLNLLGGAYGGMMGGITNIDQQGFSSAAFHAWPDMMKWDPYSGDYGMGFYGHAIASATYVADHPTFGWLGFGGDEDAAKDRISITPRDSARARLFIAPAGQWITLEEIGRARV